MNAPLTTMLQEGDRISLFAPVQSVPANGNGYITSKISFSGKVKKVVDQFVELENEKGRFIVNTDHIALIEFD